MDEVPDLDLGAGLEVDLGHEVVEEVEVDHADTLEIKSESEMDLGYTIPAQTVEVMDSVEVVKEEEVKHEEEEESHVRTDFKPVVDSFLGGVPKPYKYELKFDTSSSKGETSSPSSCSRPKHFLFSARMKEEEKPEAPPVPAGMDEVQLGDEVLHLPSEFCSNPDVLREFFSPETWQILDEGFRDQLMV